MTADAETADEGGQSIGDQLLDEAVWEVVVDSVVEGMCTPFLGAGVGWPHLPTGKELAATLAKKYEYPLGDPTNLPRVAQYISTVYDPSFMRRRVHDEIAARQNEFIESSGQTFPENYRILANLGLPIYLTTNYDDFLTRALEAAGRSPQVEICRWNSWLHDELDRYSNEQPTAERPLVFHMHGQLSDESSLLVAEDDYINFMVSAGRRDLDDTIIPHWIRRALARTTLLFVGYSGDDWNIRALTRQMNIPRHEQFLNLGIQMFDTSIPLEQRPRLERFLANQLGMGTSGARMYWGSTANFLEELDQRIRTARQALNRQI
jgi:SIR2-like domain